MSAAKKIRSRKVRAVGAVATPLESQMYPAKIKMHPGLRWMLTQILAIEISLWDHLTGQTGES